MEGDCVIHFSDRFACHISIHSLRMEGDIQLATQLKEEKISIHSLRMEGDARETYPAAAQSISIHSLRMEGDKQP